METATSKTCRTTTFKNLKSQNSGDSFLEMFPRISLLKYGIYCASFIVLKMPNPVTLDPPTKYKSVKTLLMIKKHLG